MLNSIFEYPLLGNSSLHIGYIHCYGKISKQFILFEHFFCLEGVEGVLVMRLKPIAS